MITRLFQGSLAVLVLAARFLTSGALDEIKPAMRQSAEETLVDTANLLAELVRADARAALFVGICFVSPLLVEVLQRLRFHPVQYLMVAVALAIFFLLVLALSEHLGFLPACAIASLACVGFYFAHIMRNWRLAAGFSAVLSTLCALRYGLLQPRTMRC